MYTARNKILIFFAALAKMGKIHTIDKMHETKKVEVDFLHILTHLIGTPSPYSLAQAAGCNNGEDRNYPLAILMISPGIARRCMG